MSVRRSALPLTQREEAVLLARAEGEMHKSIALRLGIAIPTVETHLWRAVRKMGARTVVGAVRKWNAERVSAIGRTRTS